MGNRNNETLVGLIIFFFILAIALPFVEEEFTGTSSQYNAQEVGDSATAGTPGLISIFFSLLTVTFWSFNVNAFVNLLFLIPLRIMFWIIVYDKVRGI